MASLETLVRHFDPSQESLSRDERYSKENMECSLPDLPLNCPASPDIYTLDSNDSKPRTVSLQWRSLQEVMITVSADNLADT
jgi:hypothetical protein